MIKKILFSATFIVTLLLSNQQVKEPKIETATSFFDLYDQNRKEQIPNYISLDFILTANYLFKQQSVTQMEQEVLYNKFKKIAFEIEANLLKGYKSEKQEALAYILVLNELLGNKIQNVDSKAMELAKKELELIKKHKGISLSPIAKVKLDYSQYKVRGKYSKTQQLTSYFLALKYMSYMPFMVNPHPATGVSPKVAKEQITNAKYIAEALKPLLKQYQDIEKIISKLSGKGDDLSIIELLKPHKDSKAFLNGLNKYPKISERIIDTTKIKKQDIPKASLALKLLPSRFTPDSYIFSQLTYPNVGEVIGKPNRLTSKIDGKLVRGYPTIEDIEAILVNKYPKESNYKNYNKQVEKLKATIRSDKPNTLYDYDFSIYKELLQKGKTNSFKGYYTQSRYILNLYQKQSYTGGLKGIFLDNRDKAYLEDNISKVLTLLIEEDKLLNNSKKFIKILKQLKELDKKHNNFNKNDIAFLNSLDSRFKSLLQDKDGKIEVDIHTNPVDGKVLYEVLDKPFVKKIDGFRGAFYNHKEEIKKRWLESFGFWYLLSHLQMQKD